MAYDAQKYEKNWTELSRMVKNTWEANESVSGVTFKIDVGENFRKKGMWVKLQKNSMGWMSTNRLERFWNKKCYPAICAG